MPHYEYFDLSVDLAKAQAMGELPDANAVLNRYLDANFGRDAETRAFIYDRAKEADTDDMAAEYIETTDPAVALNLVRRFWEKTEKLTPLETLAAIRALPGPFFDALRVAAKDMATANWERKHGK